MAADETAESAAARAALLRGELGTHVAEVQREIRSCAGCGLCCTEAHNAVRILRVEAERIARWVASRSRRSRATLRARIDGTIRTYRLGRGAAAAHYTCAFLEPDLTCALPFDVKPTACLSFNPLDRERCDQEAERFRTVDEATALHNRAAGYGEQRLPIPLAVRDALDPGRAPS